MSATQLLRHEESLPFDNETSEKYGYLVVNDVWHGIRTGETKIGRDASLCSIVLEDATLSKLHAVIESEGPEDSFIYDANSANKTKIGKMTLKPQCRYKINDNDTISLGNTTVQYRVIDFMVENQRINSGSLQSPKSDKEINVLDKNASNISENDGQSILKTGKQPEIFKMFAKPSFSVPKEVSDKTRKPCYILASKVFNTEIFSQATQSEVQHVNGKSANFKNSNFKLTHNNDDIYNMETQCHYVHDINEIDLKLRNVEGNNEEIENIRESYFDDSVTFSFVKKNENKHAVSTSMCKMISDDIFELPTQCHLEVSDSQKVLFGKDQNFKNCFSNILISEKAENKIVNAPKTKLENDSSKIKTDNHNLEDVDSEFFDIDKDEELCELMRAISPSTGNCLVKPGKRPVKNDRRKRVNLPDDIFEIATQCNSDLGCIKTVTQSKNKTAVLERDESDRGKITCSVSATNEKRNGLSGIEEGLKNSGDVFSLKTQVIKIHNTNCISHKQSKRLSNRKGAKTLNGMETYISDRKLEDEITTRRTTENSEHGASAKICPSSSNNVVCDDSRITCPKVQGCEERPASLDNSIPEGLNDDTQPGLGIKLRCEDSDKEGEETKSPLVNDTSNELLEKHANCSPVSSNRTLSDLDVSEFQANNVSALDIDIEEDFIATQAFSSLKKSEGEILDGKMESVVKERKSKLDIWKENWQDFIFTQHDSDLKDIKSESDNSDKTVSDIVAVNKPMWNIEDYEVTEMSSEEDVYSIEENSNESECLIKKRIEDGSSSSKDFDLPEEDSNEVKCELSVLLHPHIKTDKTEEDRSLFKSREENNKEEYKVDEIRVVSDSDETDCEEVLKTRKLSVNDKLPDFDNQRVDEMFPSTSDIRKKGRERRGTKKVGKDEILPEKPGDSPLKRRRKTDAEVGAAKKRTKNFRKKKENDNVRGVELGDGVAKLCRETFGSPDAKGNVAVRSSTRRRVGNSSLASRKKLEFIIEDRSKENVRSAGACTESKWKPSTVRIVFTGIESESHNKIITSLGGSRVNDLSEGNVLVTDKVRRTVKFLSAVALGLPIVSPKWLLSSSKELKFLNPWHFLLEDPASEERWGFSLKASLENWKKDKLLKGFSVFATKNTRPPVPEILSIVECCGGMALTSCPEIWPKKSIVLTCPDDKKCWPHYRNRAVKIVHYEFLLSGVLKHVLDFKTYKLR